jgi:ATP-dependent Clp protease ATP-binding subunit ClpC
LRRALEQRIEDPLAEDILRGKFEGVNTIVVDVAKDDEDKVVRLMFRGENREEPAEEPVAVGGKEE